MSITKEVIEERKSVILTDVESVKKRMAAAEKQIKDDTACLLYTSPSPRDEL